MKEKLNKNQTFPVCLDIKVIQVITLNMYLMIQ